MPNENHLSVEIKRRIVILYTSVQRQINIVKSVNLIKSIISHRHHQTHFESC